MFRCGLTNGKNHPGGPFKWLKCYHYQRERAADLFLAVCCPYSRGHTQEMRDSNPNYTIKKKKVRLSEDLSLGGSLLSQPCNKSLLVKGHLVST